MNRVGTLGCTVAALVAASCGSEILSPGPPSPGCDDCQWLIPFGLRVGPWAIAADGEHLYWVSKETAQLLRVAVGGGKTELVASWLEVSSGIAVDAEGVYSREPVPFTMSEQRLRRIDKRTGQVSVISDGNVVDGPISAADGVYFVQQAKGEAPVLRRVTVGEPTARAVVQLPIEGYPPYNFSIGSTTAAWCQPINPVQIDVAAVPSGELRSTSLEGQTICPWLAILGEMVFALADLPSEQPLRQVDPGPPVEIGPRIARGRVSAAGPYLLVTSYEENSRVWLFNPDGTEVWSRSVPFSAPVPATSDSGGIYLAGERGIVRFPWPSASAP